MYMCLWADTVMQIHVDLNELLLRDESVGLTCQCG